MFRLSSIRTGGQIIDLSDDEMTTLAKLGGSDNPDCGNDGTFARTPAVGLSKILPPRRNRRGAGRSDDPVTNALVEQRAIKMAIDLYTSEAWAVTVVGRPYDLQCTRPGVNERHVEVKGSTGEAATVTLTANEVCHASQYPTDLVVVTAIRLDRTNIPITASAGTLSRFPNWIPEPTHLRPTEYQYEVPWPQRRS